LPIVQALFTGIKAAVIIIVLKALLSLARRALAGPADWVLALLSFAAMFFLSVPFPVIIISAALWGMWRAVPTADDLPNVAPRQSHTHTLRTIVIWLTLWAAPIAVAWISGAAFLTDIALFFSKMAVVTFGGAYAVLAYMTQAVVETHGWLTTAQMIDALGLAETTPGPLILVTQFVGLLAGFQQGGTGMALLAGGMTLWVTFTPCFLWIFAGAPYVEALLARPRLKGALAGISAAVTGVILNLSVWFALHVLFDTVSRGPFGPVPALDSLQAVNAALVGLAAVLLLWLRLPMVGGLALMALAGAGLHVAT